MHKIHYYHLDKIIIICVYCVYNTKYYINNIHTCTKNKTVNFKIKLYSTYALLIRMIYLV